MVANEVGLALRREFARATSTRRGREDLQSSPHLAMPLDRPRKLSRGPVEQKFPF